MIREGAINIPFTYAAGTAGSRFLCALRDDREILGTRCRPCDRVYCPARAWCPQCGADELEWTPVGPRGVVVAVTSVADKGTFGLVRLDGADTPMVHHLLGEADVYAPGARVTARFALERTGSIRDIRGFTSTKAAA